MPHNNFACTSPDTLARFDQVWAKCNVTLDDLITLHQEHLSDCDGLGER